MKLKCLSLAVGGALATLSGSSFALPLSDYNTTAYQDVYIAGSSALDPVLLRVVALQCANTGNTIATSTIDEYSYSNEYVVTCTLNTPVLGKTKLAVHKESSNGSVNGTVAVANKQTRPFISVALLAAQPATTSACALATTSVGGAHGVPLVRVQNCANQGTTGGDIANVIPDAGVSDLEPAIFDPASAAKLTDSTVPVVQPFGVPVSVVARDALQAAQGLTVGSDTEANMPNLSKETITSVYTGNTVLWSTLGVTPAIWATANAQARADGFAVPATSPADDQIYVARRTDQVDAPGSRPNSGTQSSAEVYFTGQLCNPANQAFVFYGPPIDTAVNKTDCGTATAAPTLGPVFAGAGGGNVAACLTTHDTGGRGALGLLGAVDQPSTFGTNNAFRFVKIDGYSPSLYNVANGLYHDWVESSYNVQPGLSPTGTPNGVIVANLKTALTDVNALADVAANISSSFGANVGLLANAFAVVSGGGSPSYTVPFTAATLAGAPFANYTHEALGAPNSCQPPVQVFPANPNPGVNQG